MPTLGTRLCYLEACIKSIRQASQKPVHICVVAPQSLIANNTINVNDIDSYIEDPGEGLSAAIHLALSSLPKTIQYVNWLGDDDLLREGCIDRAIECLNKNVEAPFVFGSCDYINDQGDVLFTNHAKWWAVLLMRVGPQLIPQPGALIRRDHYEMVGGLHSELKWAFDLDLFIRLRRTGKPICMGHTLAAFRWHSGSLTVGSRRGSVTEASKVRRQFLPKILQPVSGLWEAPLRFVILKIGDRLSRKYLGLSS